jgi:hypothetical protein
MKTKRAPKNREPRSVELSPAQEPRIQQLSDIMLAGDEDNAACAAADLFRESPDQT